MAIDDGVRTPGVSVYRRSSDGLWCAAATVSTVPRRRRVFSASTRELAEDKLAAALRAGMSAVAQDVDGRPRAERMVDARRLGTHTREEWRALRRSTRTCPLCDTALNVFNVVQDHIIPIISGGSDAIDNVRPVCWECNVEKGRRADADYQYVGPRPRPFSPMPTSRASWEAFSTRRMAGLR